MRALPSIIALSTVALLACVPAPDAPVDHPATELVYLDSLPACDHEDGTAISNSLPVSACIWDASLGNGVGDSFIVFSR